MASGSFSYDPDLFSKAITKTLTAYALLQSLSGIISEARSITEPYDGMGDVLNACSILKRVFESLDSLYPNMLGTASEMGIDIANILNTELIIPSLMDPSELSQEELLEKLEAMQKEEILEMFDQYELKEEDKLKIQKWADEGNEEAILFYMFECQNAKEIEEKTKEKEEIDGKILDLEKLFKIEGQGVGSIIDNSLSAIKSFLIDNKDNPLAIIGKKFTIAGETVVFISYEQGIKFVDSYREKKQKELTELKEESDSLKVEIQELNKKQDPITANVEFYDNFVYAYDENNRTNNETYNDFLEFSEEIGYDFTNCTCDDAFNALRAYYVDPSNEGKDVNLFLVIDMIKNNNPEYQNMSNKEFFKVVNEARINLASMAGYDERLNGLDKELKRIMDSDYFYATDEEKEAYGVILEQEGKERADYYLELIESRSLFQRKGNEEGYRIFKEIVSEPTKVQEVLTAFSEGGWQGLAGYCDNIVSAVTGDYKMTANDYTSQTIQTLFQTMINSFRPVDDSVMQDFEGKYETDASKIADITARINRGEDVKYYELFGCVDPENGGLTKEEIEECEEMFKQINGGETYTNLVLKNAYSAGASFGNMLPSVALGMVPYLGPALSKVSFFASAYGGTFREQRREGVSFGDAMLAAAVDGGLELGTEYLVGGIPFISKNTEEIGAFLKAPISGKLLILGKEIASEELEESLQLLGGDYIVNNITGEKYDIKEKLSQLPDTLISTFMSTLAMNSLSYGTQSAFLYGDAVINITPEDWANLYKEGFTPSNFKNMLDIKVKSGINTNQNGIEKMSEKLKENGLKQEIGIKKGKFVVSNAEITVEEFEQMLRSSIKDDDASLLNIIKMAHNFTEEERKKLDSINPNWRNELEIGEAKKILEEANAEPQVVPIVTPEELSEQSSNAVSQEHEDAVETLEEERPMRDLKEEVPQQEDSESVTRDSQSARDSLTEVREDIASQEHDDAVETLEEERQKRDLKEEVPQQEDLGNVTRDSQSAREGLNDVREDIARQEHDDAVETLEEERQKRNLKEEVTQQEDSESVTRDSQNARDSLTEVREDIASQEHEDAVETLEEERQKRDLKEEVPQQEDSESVKRDSQSTRESLTEVREDIASQEHEDAVVTPREEGLQNPIDNIETLDSNTNQDKSLKEVNDTENNASEAIQEVSEGDNDFINQIIDKNELEISDEDKNTLRQMEKISEDNSEKVDLFNSLKSPDAKYAAVALFSDVDTIGNLFNLNDKATVDNVVKYCKDASTLIDKYVSEDSKIEYFDYLSDDSKYQLISNASKEDQIKYLKRLDTVTEANLIIDLLKDVIVSPEAQMDYIKSLNPRDNQSLIYNILINSITDNQVIKEGLNSVVNAFLRIDIIAKLDPKDRFIQFLKLPATWLIQSRGINFLSTEEKLKVIQNENTVVGKVELVNKLTEAEKKAYVLGNADDYSKVYALCGINDVDFQLEHIKDFPLDLQVVVLSKITKGNIKEVNRIGQQFGITYDIYYETLADIRKTGYIGGRDLLYSEFFSNEINSIALDQTGAVSKFFQKMRDGIDGYYGADQNATRKYLTYEYKDKSFIKNNINEIESYAINVKGLTDEKADAIMSMLRNNDKVATLDEVELVQDYVASLVGNDPIQYKNIIDSIFDSPIKGEEYIRLQKKLESMGVTSERVQMQILNSLNTVGICSYAAFADAIFAAYSEDPIAFKHDFGYDMTSVVNGREHLNSSELLLDMYLFANSNLYRTDGKEFFNFDDSGKLELSSKLIDGKFNTEDQLYFSSWSKGFNLEAADAFLKSKNSNINIKLVEFIKVDKNMFYTKQEFIRIISEYLFSGKQIYLGLSWIPDYSKFTMINSEYFMNQKSFTDAGHAVLITEIGNTYVHVSSWGYEYLIPIDEFLDNRFSISVLEIEGSKTSTESNTGINTEVNNNQASSADNNSLANQEYQALKPVEKASDDIVIEKVNDTETNDTIISDKKDSDRENLKNPARAIDGNSNVIETLEEPSKTISVSKETKQKIAQKEKFLNAREILNSKIKQIKEAFISFYSERYRSKIEEAFANTLFIPFLNPDSLSSTIKDIAKTISNDLEGQFLESIGILATEENIKKCFNYENIDSPSSSLSNIYKLIDSMENDEFKEYDKEYLIRYLSIMFLDSEVTEENYQEYIDILKEEDKKSLIRYLNMVFLNSEITEENYQEYVDILRKQKSFYDELVESYHEQIKAYDEQKSKVEEYQNTKSILSKKYEFMFFDSIKELLSEHDREVIERYRDNPLNFNIRDLDTKLYDFFEDKSLIDAFSSESEEALNGNNQYQINAIKEKRIQYFKALGLDLGNDYDTYMNYPEISKYIPSSKQLEKIIRIRSKLTQDMASELVKETNFYKDAAPLIRELGLDPDKVIDCDYLYITKTEDSNKYSSSSAWVQPVIRDDNTLQNVLFINVGEWIETLDKLLFHEINHTIENHLISVDRNANAYTVQTGWDFVYGHVSPINDVEVDHLEKREFEYLSEIVNEWLSQEVYHENLKRDTYIFGEKDNVVTRGTTSYENARDLVSKFYQEFKNEIVQSRINSDMNILFDAVGRENLIKLNQLMGRFFQNFGGFNYRNMLSERKNGLQTERVKLYNEMLREADEIFEDMMVYSESNSANATITHEDVKEMEKVFGRIRDTGTISELNRLIAELSEVGVAHDMTIEEMANYQVSEENSTEAFKKAQRYAKMLYEEAKNAEPRITEAMEMLQDSNLAGITFDELKEKVASGETSKFKVLIGLDHRLKQEKSLSEKIYNDAKIKYQDDLKEKGMVEVDSVSEEKRIEELIPDAASEIGDRVRYTLLIDDESYIKEIESTLRELENKGYTIKKPKNLWGKPKYQGVNTRITTPDGVSFELQFHTLSSFYVKEILTHEYYQIERSKQLPLSESEKKIATSIQKEFQKLVPRPEGIIGYEFNWR